MTLAEAERRCGAAAACFGFEFNSHDRAPPGGAVLRVTFRRRARFNPDRGNTVTQHNPAPVAVDGRALVVFQRNTGVLLAKRALDAGATRWGPATPLVDASGAAIEAAVPGPPGGLVFEVAGRQRIAIAVGRSGRGGAALLSDDGGATWRFSAPANPRGGEAQIAMAGNGSLLLNSRGPVQGVRWQSESRDGGETWSQPRVLDFGFGSSCEGSLLAPDACSLLFSQPQTPTPCSFRTRGASPAATTAGI